MGNNLDRDTIYLDNDDEITSVIDKLKGSDFSSVDLVIPKEALVLKSVVNLKLLKKQAESLGKEIVVVTQDKVGKKLAAQIGIPVIEKPGQQPPEVRMTEAEEPMKAAAPAAVLSEDDIEIKKDAKPVVPEEENDGIEFKEPASPIVPTSEVVGDAAIAGIAGEEEAEDKKADLGTPKGKKKRFGWKSWLLVAGFGGLALFVAAYILVPLANVTVRLAAEKKAVDFNFTADKTYTAVDTSAQTIPAKVVTVEKTKDQQFTATGKKKTGTKATGTITAKNEFSTDPVAIVAGTRFVSSGNLVFRANSNFTIPGFTQPGGVMKAGTVDVAVTADAVGAEYNIGASHFTVPALGTSKVYGDSGSAMAGGTSRDVTYVTQTDVNTAKEDLAKSIETDLVNDATQKAGEGYRVLEKAYKVTQVSATSSPDVNGEGTNFTLTVKAKIDAITFKEEDLTKLATAVLGDQIGSGKEIVDASSLTSAAEFTEGDFDKGTIKVKVSGEAYVATKLDQNAVKTEIAGEPNNKALEYLNGIDGVSGAQITRQFPSFLKRLPRIKSHLYIKVELDKK